MMDERLRIQDELFLSLRAHRIELQKILDEVNSEWGYESSVYRFYHRSFKVYHFQSLTKRIADKLISLAPPGCEIDPIFLQIMAEGASGKAFESEHNRDWAAHTRAMVEALAHAKYFLEMAVKYGERYEACPRLLPEGLAALLELYGVR